MYRNLLTKIKKKNKNKNRYKKYNIYSTTTHDVAKARVIDLL